MLDHDESRRLDDIAYAVARDDPRFAASLGQGEPCPPREYRGPRQFTVVVTVVFGLLGLVIGQLGVAVVLAGVVAAAGVVVYRWRRDRPTVRRR